VAKTAPLETRFRAENAERKLGGRAEALAPHLPRGVFIWFGGPQGHRKPLDQSRLCNALHLLSRARE
jgi:hypothetical protein